MAMTEVCGSTCPGSTRVCERPPHDDDEHRTTLTPGRTYLWWAEGSTHVRYRTGTVEQAEALLNPSALHALETEHE